MNARGTLLALFLCGTLSAMADAPPWHSTVEGPRGLPAVEIDLGYPGGYVSAVSSPLVLRIRTGARRFDGYVGFAIAVGRSRTVDTPIVTRVALAPHSEKVFSTWARTLPMGATRAEYLKREVLIDWRNDTMTIIGTRSAGAPPWQTGQPLRLPSPNTLGTNAQWYAGFSRVITPFDYWFTLPIAVREAIFRSARRVVFVGPPQRMPQLTAVDRALLPIEVRAEAMTLDVPWPYRADGNGTKPVAFSWVAKPGTRFSGSPKLPYVVANGIATFIAGDHAEVPSFRTTVARDRQFTGPVQRTPRAREIFLELRPLLTTLFVIPLPLIAWFAARRRPRVLIAAVICATVIALILVRDSVRPAAVYQEAAVLRIETPGVFDRVASTLRTGPAPIAAAGVLAGDSITWSVFNVRDIEERTSASAPGFGKLNAPGAWASAIRRLKRRELGTPASIQVRPSGSDLIVAYDGTLPVDYVSAEWLCGARRCEGTAAANGKSKGEITVRNGIETWLCLGCLIGELEGALPPTRDGAVWVGLVSLNGRATTAVSQIDPPGSPSAGPPYSVLAPLEDQGGTLRATFALPATAVGGSHASVKLQTMGGVGPPSRITLAGEAGSLTRDVDPRKSAGFLIAFGELRQVAPAGGIVTATVEPLETTAPGDLVEARLYIDERKP